MAARAEQVDAEQLEAVQRAGSSAQGLAAWGAGATCSEPARHRLYRAVVSEHWCSATTATSGCRSVSLSAGAAGGRS